MPELSSADAIFQRWLDAGESGGNPDLEMLLAGVPEEVRAAVRSRVADYQQDLLDLRASRSSLQPGAHLGPYVLVRKLGEGGMGEVWEAQEPALGRNVALKLLPPLFGLQPSARVRFQREALAVGRIHHPSVLRVHRVGTVEGAPFLATELVPGGRNLAHWIADLHRAGPPERADYSRIAELFARIAEGLAAVHAQGILHRDLKPSNVLIDADDHPLLADFGMARIVGAETLTLTRSQVGTIPYMPPELIRSGRVADERSDLYSLGVTLYETLCGSRPFEGDTEEQVRSAILEDEPIPPRLRRSRVPADLEVLCLRCLEKEPARRPASAWFLAEEFRRILNDQPIRTRPPGLASRALKAVRRNPWRSAAVGTLAAALIAALFFLDRLATRNASLEEALADTGVVADLVQPAAFGPNRSEARAYLRKQRARLDQLDLSASRRAAILADLGRGMVHVDEFGEAREWLEEALAQSAATQAPRAQRAEIELFLAWAIGRVTREEGDFDRAEALLRGVIADPGADDGAAKRALWARNRLGQVLHESANEASLRLAAGESLDPVWRERWSEAGRLWSELAEELQGADDPVGLEVLALTQLDLGVHQFSTDPIGTPDFETALRHFHAARQTYMRAGGPEHPELSYVDLGEAMALRGLDRLPEALEVLDRASARILRLYGQATPMLYEVGATRLELTYRLHGREAARSLHEEQVRMIGEGVRPFRFQGETWQADALAHLERVWSGLDAAGR